MAKKKFIKKWQQQFQLQLFEHKDETEKQHRYALDFPKNYNYTNINIYGLTKE